MTRKNDSREKETMSIQGELSQKPYPKVLNRQRVGNYYKGASFVNILFLFLF